MLKLPNVTLIALTGLGYKTAEHVEALKKSSQDIEFGAVKLIQLAEVVDIDSWNKAIIYELPKYVETSHCLLIHDDGFMYEAVSLGLKTSLLKVLGFKFAPFSLKVAFSWTFPP